MTNGDKKLTDLWTVVGIIITVILTGIGTAGTLNRSIGRVEGDISGLRDRFDDFAQDFVRFDERLTRFDDITDRLELQVGVLEVQVAALTSGVSRLNNGVSRFERTTNALQGSLDELRTDQQRITSEIAALREAQRTIQPQVDRTVRYIAPAESEPIPQDFYQDVMARLSRIETLLNAMAERIGDPAG